MFPLQLSESNLPKWKSCVTAQTKSFPKVGKQPVSNSLFSSTVVKTPVKSRQNRLNF